MTATFDFSPLAASYARARPRYPAELFAFLASLVARRELAWDCATGNGQAAAGLAVHFERVIATDRSAEQIRHAVPDPRIDYRVAPAEASGLDASSVDLVTIGAAAHWLDLPAFGREVERVTRPGGVLAAFTYHLAIVSAPFDAIFGRLYWEVLKPHFSVATKLVDERYETLPLPGTPIPTPSFELAAEWTLADALEFVRTWSGSAAYRAATGVDAAELVRGELEAIWRRDEVTERTERTLRVTWPLFLRAQRLG